jgi:hypothetical protein
MIYLITQQHKDVLESLTNFDIVFRPIQDANDIYLISENEYYFIMGLWHLDECPIDLFFIPSLTPSEYFPKPQTPLV